VLESNPASERTHLWLAVTCAQVGREADAQWEIDQIVATNPETPVSRMRTLYPFTDPDDVARLIEGLHKADLTD
jgi:hypothetical protein